MNKETNLEKRYDRALAFVLDIDDKRGISLNEKNRHKIHILNVFKAITSQYFYNNIDDIEKEKDSIVGEVALLHDIYNSMLVTREMLLRAGFSKNVLDILDIIVRRKDETYSKYILRIRKSTKLVRSIVYHDILCHLNEDDCYNKDLLILASVLLEK